MLKNYLKIALKVLMRRKFFTAISLFGICFTLTVLLVVVAMIDHLFAPVVPEVHLDRTLHVFSVGARGSRGEFAWNTALKTGYGFLDRYVRDIDGVEKMAITSDPYQVVSFLDGERITSAMRHVDTPYWEILKFDFIEGGPLSTEDEESGGLVAVISDAVRRRFFGDDPAQNRMIEVDGRRFRVVGVVKNVPATRMSAAADIWTPLSAAKTQGFRNEMFAGYFGTGFAAILLAESSKEIPKIKTEFESRLHHVEPQDPYSDFTGVPLNRLEQFAMQAQGTSDGKPPVLAFSMIILGMAAVFLLLPTTNLITINLSRFMERSAEIGVRKTFGASSAHLVGQFIIENILLCLAGGLISLVCTGVILTMVESAGWIPYADFQINFRVFVWALGLALFFGLISGAYPAWRTSRMHPVQALKGGVR